MRLEAHSDPSVPFDLAKSLAQSASLIAEIKALPPNPALNKAQQNYLTSLKGSLIADYEDGKAESARLIQTVDQLIQRPNTLFSLFATGRITPKLSHTERLEVLKKIYKPRDENNNKFFGGRLLNEEVADERWGLYFRDDLARLLRTGREKEAAFLAAAAADYKPEDGFVLRLNGRRRLPLGHDLQSIIRELKRLDQMSAHQRAAIPFTGLDDSFVVFPFP